MESDLDERDAGGDGDDGEQVAHMAAEQEEEILQNDGQHADALLSLPDPPLPHLTEAIRVRWFQADLSNVSASTAVYDEV